MIYIFNININVCYEYQLVAQYDFSKATCCLLVGKTNIKPGIKSQNPEIPKVKIPKGRTAGIFQRIANTNIQSGKAHIKEFKKKRSV